MTHRTSLLSRILQQVLCVSASCLPGLLPASTLELASPFVDHAILQRDMPVPVWGWATPGDRVVVAFGDHKQSARAGKDGSWRVDLPSLKASAEPRAMTVSSGDASVTRQDMLVGEVWFASGQSNMDWLAGKSNVRDLAREIGQAKAPIHEYTVDTGSSLFPNSRAASEGGWKGPEQASNFSALALAFAAELHRELQVPIGILRSSHGATPVETWTAYEGYADHPDLQDIAQRIRESDPGTEDGRAAYEAYYAALKQWQTESAALLDKGGHALPQPPLPGIAGDWKGASRMFNKKVAPLIPYAIRGIIWCQGESNSNDGKIYAAKKEALINGWRTHWKRPDLPFYFTQLQCYGTPDMNTVGFADLREAQTQFFRENEHVGMVVQTDLNPARPQGIHPFNKLDPGKRLARWALHHDYGRKDLAYTGPLYASHSVEGSGVRVTFAQRGPGGGLTAGTKGMEADAKNSPNAFVEPARPTPGEPLQQFRLAGKDKVWHPASAQVIGPNEVLVSSRAVREPVGVQYAYNNSPIGSNLINEAGLPAVPFAVFNGKPMFKEDDAAVVAAEKAEAERRYGKRSYLLPMSLLRDRVVLQRDQPIPIWGHGIPGSEITVSFAGQEQKTKVDAFERWRVDLNALPAATAGRELVIRSSADEERRFRDVLVGDVWFLTGTRKLDGEVFRFKPDEKPELKPLPLVREFRVKTKARRFQTPRKLRMEIGGGKYVASWQPADFDGVGDNPSVAAYHFAAAAQDPGIPLGIVTLGSDNPPLTWISIEGMQHAKGFEAERDEINLAWPNTGTFQRALDQYFADMRAYVADVSALRKAGREIPPPFAEATPPFPAPAYNQWASYTETATHTYNFCIAPNTPFGVRGVVWVPGEKNLGEDPSRYAAAVNAYAADLAGTYGQDRVAFVYAHPTGDIAGKVGTSNLPGAVRVDFDAWPKSLADVATRLGKAARK